MSEQNVMFSLDELAILARHVTAGANRTKDSRLRRKLERIVERIERLTMTFEEAN